MDVWQCLDSAQSVLSQRDVEHQRLHTIRRVAPKLCSQIAGFADEIYDYFEGFRDFNDLDRGIPSYVRDEVRHTSEISPFSQYPTDEQVLSRVAKCLIPRVISTHSHGMVVDDRPIYWGRLLSQVFFNWYRQHDVPAKVRRELCAQHEINSRCYYNKAAQVAAPSERRIILTAFDPFMLNSNIQQSNPSASVALTLAEIYKNHLPIEVVTFPVRYRDFNKHLVERMLKPRFERDPLLMISFSMGRVQFDLERFVGRKRSSTALDNLDYSPVRKGKIPPCVTKAPEFLEFTLPTESLLDVTGPWNVHDNRTVATKKRGEFEAQSLSELANEICVRASGGGFLSNEIAYRSRLLQLQMNKSFPLGHIHVPKTTRFWPSEMWKMIQQAARIFDRLLQQTPAS